MKKFLSIATLLLVLSITFIGFAAVSCDSQTTSSNNNATTAGNKWGT